MYGDDVRARLYESFDVFLGVYDHQMTIERQRGTLPEVLHHFDTEGDIVDENTVHDVAVHDVRAVCFEVLYFLAHF